MEPIQPNPYSWNMGFRPHSHTESPEPQSRQPPPPANRVPLSIPVNRETPVVRPLPLGEDIREMAQPGISGSVDSMLARYLNTPEYVHTRIYRAQHPASGRNDTYHCMEDRRNAIKRHGQRDEAPAAPDRNADEETRSVEPNADQPSPVYHVESPPKPEEREWYEAGEAYSPASPDHRLAQDPLELADELKDVGSEDGWGETSRELSDPFTDATLRNEERPQEDNDEEEQGEKRRSSQNSSPFIKSRMDWPAFDSNQRASVRASPLYSRNRRRANENYRPILDLDRPRSSGSNAATGPSQRSSASVSSRSDTSSVSTLRLDTPQPSGRGEDVEEAREEPQQPLILVDGDCYIHLPSADGLFNMGGLAARATPFVHVKGNLHIQVAPKKRKRDEENEEDADDGDDDEDGDEEEQ